VESKKSFKIVIHNIISAINNKIHVQMSTCLFQILMHSCTNSANFQSFNVQLSMSRKVFSVTEEAIALQLVVPNIFILFPANPLTEIFPKYY